MRFASATDVGHVRSRNEDALLVDDDRGLLVVADGMGGHPAGDLASRLAVRHVDDDLADLTADGQGGRMDALRRAIQGANRVVFDEAGRRDGTTGMGTTLVVAHVDEPEGLVTVATVGDSRAYLLTGGRLLRLTHDDTAGGPFGRVLTQAIGAMDPVEPEVLECPAGAGDRLLLCTDGLTDELDDDRIGSLLGKGGIDDAAQALVDAALASGGRDNVTVAVAQIDGP